MVSAYSFYCQLVDNVLQHPPQLDLILHEDEVARLIRTLYQADPSKDHVTVYRAVCTELLSEFTVARLCMGLYFATKYLNLIEELEQPSKAELVDLRLRLADVLKSHLAPPQKSRRWAPWFMGVTAGLIGILTYHQIKHCFNLVS